MRIILFAVCLAFLASCNQKPSANNAATIANDSTFTITGNIAGMDTGKIIFLKRAENDKLYDTVNIVKGAFEFKGKVPVSDGMSVYTCFVDGKDDADVILMVDNEAISFKATADSFEKAFISGSKVQDDWNAFNKLTAPVDSAMQVLGKEFDNTKDNDSLLSIDKAYNHYDTLRQNFVLPFVKAHPSSVMSAYIIGRTMLVQPDVKMVQPAYNVLDSSVKQSKFGKVIVEVLDAVKKTAIGQIAPDFTMNDRDGKPVTLSSLRGKYIFLDFWASWCGPCRKENPNIVAAYAKFHSAKFDILGVSLDNKKDKWEAAIDKDKLTWQHVSDLQDWANAAAKLYGIRAIPANLLLDKDGRILARNLYGSQLEKKLAEVLK